MNQRARYRGQSLGLPPSGPESIASWGSRVGATVIDAVIVGVPYAVLTIALVALAQMTEDGRSVEGGEQPGALVILLGWLILVAPAFLYQVGLVAVRGATLGKSMLGIKVVRVRDGAVPGWGVATGRWLVTTALGFTGIGSVIDYLFPLFDDNGRTLHDHVAGTIVIRTR